jgi:hypothetical protein
MWGCGVGPTGSGCDPMVGMYEYGNEPIGYMKQVFS